MNRTLSLATTLALGSLLACGGGSSSSSPQGATPTSGFRIRTAATTTPAAAAGQIRTKPASMMVPLPEAVAVDPDTLTLLFGVAATESGALVCGYSGSGDAQTFDISTVTPDGVTVGGNGVSETFQPSDPSIINGALTGPGTINLPAPARLGLFLAQFSTRGSTVLTMTPGQYTNAIGTPQAPGSLAQADELVLRIGSDSEPLIDAGGHTATLACGPHFTSSGGMYCDLDSTLSIGGVTEYGSIEYFLFMPASRIGIGASFFVSGGNTVIDPVADGTDHVDPTTWTLTSPSTWVLKDPMAWIHDPGCAGLLQVADAVVAANPGTTLTAVATYFENYFGKFYAADSTMFNDPGYGTLGNGGGSASFIIIALDDLPGGPGTTPVPMALDGASVVNLVWNAADAAYSLSNGILDLEGNPPIPFTATISQ